MRNLNQLVGQLNDQSISRRQFIVQATRLGLSIPAISVILAACGGGDDTEDTGAADTEPTATSTSGDSGGSEPTATSSGSGGASATATTGGGTNADPTEGAAGTMAATPGESTGSGGRVVWVSPRGTLEVLDDYPFWIADSFGWFGDIETVMEPGPMDATATTKLVAQGEADMGYPSPGVFSLALEAGIPVTSVFQMGALDTFDFAFPKGSNITSLEDLVGKTITLGSAGWQSIADPEFAQLDLDPSSNNYVVAGPTWAQALDQGQGDAALSWEGLRAQWKGQGLEFDYLLGKNFSEFPANSFVIRTEDLEDEAMRDLYGRYLRGWAMGLAFGHLNPRATTQYTMDQFPALAEQMDPPIAVESMMQLAAVYRGDFESREGWGWHDFSSWSVFLETIADLGQVSEVFDPETILTNDFVSTANDFDMEVVQKAAEGFELRPEYEEVDVEAIRERL